MLMKWKAQRHFIHFTTAASCNESPSSSKYTGNNGKVAYRYIAYKSPSTAKHGSKKHAGRGSNDSNNMVNDHIHIYPLIIAWAFEILYVKAFRMSRSFAFRTCGP